MGFKQYLTEEISVRAPKPNNKITFTVNLKELYECFSNTILPCKKSLIKNVNGNGEVPVYCEELKRFYMLRLSDKKLKARELKSREDKELAGGLLNGMIVKEAKEPSEAMKQLVEMKLHWEAPNLVYGVKDEFGKTINLKTV